MFKHYGVVDSEAGLLLLGDAAVLQAWAGSEAENSQRDEITTALQAEVPGIALPIADGVGILWDIEGPGSMDIFMDKAAGQLRLVRGWLEEGIMEEEKAIRALCDAPAALEAPFAEFSIASGCLGILDAPESGECIRKTARSRYKLIEEEMMSESSGLLLTLPAGQYRCFHDRIVLEQGEARRCHIIRI